MSPTKCCIYSYFDYRLLCD